MDDDFKHFNVIFAFSFVFCSERSKRKFKKGKHVFQHVFLQIKKQKRFFYFWENAFYKLWSFASIHCGLWSWNICLRLSHSGIIRWNVNSFHVPT